MSRTDPPPGAEQEPGGEREPEFSIARSNALAPLLVLFAITVLGIVIAIVRARPYVPPVGAPANRSFSPADFPLVFGTQDLSAPLEVASGGGAASLFPVPAPPFSDGIFPCSDCHAGLEPNPERRELTMHTDIELRHDEEHRWCLDCHAPDDRDQLRLASGALVPFTESYRLCGQCHGTQYRDWRTGIHGKRTGYWDGPKRYLLCVHCHNPHHPRFASLEPLPPPIRPQFLGARNLDAATTPRDRRTKATEERDARETH
jgi:hypothetical protein